MRCTPVRYTPVRQWSALGRQAQARPSGPGLRITSEDHCREVHAREMHACEMYVYEIHTLNMHACEVHADARL
jgi:hypothetical protein